MRVTLDSSVSLGCRVRGAGLVALALCLGTPVAQAAAAGRLLSDAPILPAWLAHFDVEINVSADSLKWNGYQLNEIQAPLRMRARALEISAARALVAGGNVTLTVDYQLAGETRLSIEASQIELGQLGTLSKFVRGTPVHVALDITGRGASPRDIVTSSHGVLSIKNTAPGQILKSVENASSTLFGTLFSAFNPFRSKDAVTVLECLAVDVPIAAGRVSDSDAFALRTERMRVAGGGKIDFTTESISLTLTPEARSGVNIKGLAAINAIVVEGSLAAPTVRLDGDNLLQRAAGLGVSVAFVGGSALKAAFGDKPDPGELCPD